MEYHENPEERREENGEEKKEEFSFMQETIKDEDAGYRKIRNTVMKYAGLGLIFGLAACLGFYALRPWVEDRFSSNPRTITIPEEEEEETQEGEEGQTEETSPVLTVDDYEQLNQSLVTVANTVNRSMVEISVQVSQPEEQDQTLVDEDSVAGVIFEDNGVELLVAARSLTVPEGGSLRGRLMDGNYYSVSVKKQDANLGIAVYAIAKNALSEGAWNQIQTVALGSSGGVSKGDIVIAVGSPFGYYGGMGFGVISSTRETVRRADGEYSLLCTDIGGSTSGTGILVNTDGQIIGMIDQERFYSDGESGPVAAYGISDLKEALEFLSNGQSVPYVGIQGVTVTEELTASQGIPAGVYVQEVSADSPAMAAGIQSGDVITEVDGTAVTTLSGYNSVLMQQEEGDEIRVEGQRQGTGGYVDITFRVTVGSKE